MKTKNLFAGLFFICLGTSVNAQITIPYPVTNGSCVDMTISIELVDPNCNVCDFGSYTIQPGVTLMFGGNCGMIQDVHIILTDINGCPIPLPYTDIVSDPDPCMNPSASTSVNITGSMSGCGISCPPAPNMMTYTPAGTIIQ